MGACKKSCSNCYSRNNLSSVVTPAYQAYHAEGSTAVFDSVVWRHASFTDTINGRVEYYRNIVIDSPARLVEICQEDSPYNFGDDQARKLYCH